MLYQLSSQAICRPEFFLFLPVCFKYTGCQVAVYIFANDLTFSLVDVLIIFGPGFDDQDMERPSFTQPAVHPAVPLLLSKPGAEPVIQVSSNPVNCCMFTARKPLLVGKTFLAN